MMWELFKILAICLIAAVLSLVLKSKSGEYAFLITLTAGIIIMITVLKGIAEPIKEISQTLTVNGVKTEYFKVALKSVGLAYITDFIADACRDAGQNSMAAGAELAGKAAIFMLSVPLLMSVLETATGFVK